jgi:hypothetical protein
MIQLATGNTAILHMGHDKSRMETTQEGRDHELGQNVYSKYAQLGAVLLKKNIEEATRGRELVRSVVSRRKNIRNFRSGGSGARNDGR